MDTRIIGENGGILIAHNNVFLRRKIKNGLCKNGYSVFEASRGKRAVDMLLNQPKDCRISFLIAGTRFLIYSGVSLIGMFTNANFLVKAVLLINDALNEKTIERYRLLCSVPVFESIEWPCGGDDIVKKCLSLSSKISLVRQTGADSHSGQNMV